ncbi:hypothetical protein [Cohnella soli]|uniref:DNA-binding protein n=1 Tax=Cohnella soli TaxID=425005 RepID=A0ABW0HSS9_9BACL
MENEKDFKLSFVQLTKVFNIDYSGMWKIKAQIKPDIKHKETASISSEEIESYLIRNKESSFLFDFEEDSQFRFLYRCYKSEIYDVRLEPEEWLEPKVLKFLLDLEPMALHRLRKQKKLVCKKEVLSFRKETSRNSYQYLYEKQSVIDFIQLNYGDQNLSKSFTTFHDEPQFFTVAQTLRFLTQENVSMSLPSLYRNISRQNIPACRIKDAIRIPIKEFNLWLSENRGI